MLPLVATVLLAGVLLSWLRFAWVLARIGTLPDLSREPVVWPPLILHLLGESETS